MQTVLECKSCGGQLQPVEGARIVYCGYCGSANVFSYVDRFSLYNQANYLRQRNEFDRAISVYENIINEDPKDAEAYFGIALCKYGIEYVKDPADERMIPTCHRTRIKLFSQDEDYEKAVSLSEPNVADVYKIEAEKIDHILKGIQKLSYNQKKYDVFICYKESDENGERTRTSVIAQDVYEQLTAKGYSVFFARKTLAGMIGSDYEPVIFSALYSAKVMLVIGTRPEEFQGIWVKNEWIRFLERIAEGDECTLIPCYKEMSPYELPQEMVNIQSLDISKIGFMQDITDALERLIKGTSTAQVSDVHIGNAVGLRKRAYIFLEQGEFAQADRYFERALDIDPEDSECYWGKLLAGMSCRSEEQLCNILTPISGKNDYRVALKFANEEQSEKYRRYSDLIDEKIAEENRRKEEQAMFEKERAARAAKLAEEEAERQRILRAEEREHIEREKKRKRAVIVKRMIAVFLPLGILLAFAIGALIINQCLIENRQEKINALLDEARTQFEGFDDDVTIKVVYSGKMDKEDAEIEDHMTINCEGEKVYLIDCGLETYRINEDFMFHSDYSGDSYYYYFEPSCFTGDNVKEYIDWLFLRDNPQVIMNLSDDGYRNDIGGLYIAIFFDYNQEAKSLDNQRVVCRFECKDLASDPLGTEPWSDRGRMEGELLFPVEVGK